MHSNLYSSNYYPRALPRPAPSRAQCSPCLCARPCVPARVRVRPCVPLCAHLNPFPLTLPCVAVLAGAGALPRAGQDPLRRAPLPLGGRHGRAADRGDLSRPDLPPTGHVHRGGAPCRGAIGPSRPGGGDLSGDRATAAGHGPRGAPARPGLVLALVLAVLLLVRWWWC
jgi:hypothetical protein